MIKATLFTDSFYLNNRVFDKVSMNDSLYGFYVLKEKFREKGIDLSTQDINPPSEAQFIIYNEMPKIRDIMPDKDSYLLMLESKIIKSDNWNTKKHKYFKKIFTWDNNLVDGRNYLKINYAHKIPTDLDYDMSKKEKLCTMVASHKFESHSLELYTERIKAIRWFEQNHPKDFDLYGIGWDRHCFKGALTSLNRFQSMTKLLIPKYSSFKGPAPSRTVLPKYKFAICYENARDIPSYITEKIFNCFFAGCVPIYWGAPNVTDFIPEDTFIDRRKFNSYEELYDYIKNMPDEEYLGYLAAIKNFIESPEIYPFSAECFADTIISEILKND
ncbi:MAG: hypothetical protein EMLJLAPB_00189 [Candidatus Argoarchaeum ethanivorans]|uniref:Fucosyltransferase C-terminal domain-containing protein n=1 Tax=Candidatus Argoarchaeum ethanivorans TaxID=2608793 RepID=A0A811T8F7_9EURY|nr:MAG: hypothetical protein EMLJLAPB_00189 [Candidatus Argoarchaeum ethanivorans]